MTQIKSIKGIAGKLPKFKKNQIGYYKPDVLSTDLDPNECACVDVEKVVDILANRVPFYADPDINEIRKIANTIATSNCVKWRKE